MRGLGGLSVCEEEVVKDRNAKLCRCRFCFDAEGRDLSVRWLKLETGAVEA